MAKDDGGAGRPRTTSAARDDGGAWPAREAT